MFVGPLLHGVPLATQMTRDAFGGYVENMIIFSRDIKSFHGKKTIEKRNFGTRRNSAKNTTRLPNFYVFQNSTQVKNPYQICLLDPNKYRFTRKCVI